MKVVLPPEHAQVAEIGGEPLQALCRQEVEQFHEYLKANDANWRAGLSTWEKQVVAAYLYQKLRGRVGVPTVSQVPEELRPRS